MRNYIGVRPVHWTNGLCVRYWLRRTGFNPMSSHTKDSKMELDVPLHNTQHSKVWIKGKMEQSREKSSGLPLHLGVVAIEKGPFESPSTKVTNYITFTYIYISQQFMVVTISRSELVVD